MNWDELFKEPKNRWLNPAPVILDYLRFFKEHNLTTAIDYGCGSGRHTLEMVKQGFFVYFTDVSQEAILQTTSKLEETHGLQNYAIWNIQGEIVHLADFCICVSSIHHNYLHGIETDLRKIYTSVKENGYLVTIVPSILHPTYNSGTQVEPFTWITDTGVDKGIPHHFFDERRLSDLMIANGFTVLEIKAIGIKELAGINNGHLCCLAKKITNENISNRRTG